MENTTSDATARARSDLAFMKAVVEDRGPLAWIIGAHLFWPGLIFGINFIFIWAIAAGLAQWPLNGLDWSWTPGAAAYGIVALYLWRRARGETLGPSARGFAAAWSMVGVMSAATVGVLMIATARTNAPFYEAWPALAFVIYGGSWTVASAIRKRAWLGMVALGAYATGLLAAARLNAPDMWLVEAAGAFLFVAPPGALIMHLAKQRGASV